MTTSIAYRWSPNENHQPPTNNDYLLSPIDGGRNSSRGGLKWSETVSFWFGSSDRKWKIYASAPSSDRYVSRRPFGIHVYSTIATKRPIGRSIYICNHGLPITGRSES
ncbi:inositol-phosphate phosphatase [Anopheles sinensis]|uniref:Inositol-phosphate phosphatase n=1 Tax=Anopheles sinensis TaxID=74873 RepID=A0A084VKN8_ANOSI|nr:inositol-phosphate phosphatase [Anopheles sinensis]